MKKVDNFKLWAIKQYQNCLNETNKYIYWVARSGKHVKTFCANRNTGKFAMARCPIEEHYFEVGVGVAYARLKGIPIPLERKKVKVGDCKYGTKCYYHDAQYVVLTLIPYTNFYALYETHTNQLRQFDKNIEVYVD